MKWYKVKSTFTTIHYLQTPLGILAKIHVTSDDATGTVRQAFADGSEYVVIAPRTSLSEAKQACEACIRELCRDTLGELLNNVDPVQGINVFAAEND